MPVWRFQAAQFFYPASFFAELHFNLKCCDVAVGYLSHIVLVPLDAKWEGHSLVILWLHSVRLMWPRAEQNLWMVSSFGGFELLCCWFLNCSDKTCVRHVKHMSVYKRLLYAVSTLYYEYYAEVPLSPPLGFSWSSSFSKMVENDSACIGYSCICCWFNDCWTFYTF